MLARIGDDRQRFADARGLRGLCRLLTHHQSLREEIVHHRRGVKNDRLNHAGYLWAFSAITASPGAKAHYRRRRETTETGTQTPSATCSTA
ncbi:hypothetical protein ACFWJW_34380 [Streptomyces sp. NPDC127097]|uniref:hypothetical protein n=1 Tax=Streptomyces sp. NPDC127097 TaxID=3347136 RepID=UPI003652F3F6